MGMPPPTKDQVPAHRDNLSLMSIRAEAVNGRCFREVGLRQKPIEIATLIDVALRRQRHTFSFVSFARFSVSSSTVGVLHAIGAQRAFAAAALLRPNRQ